VGLRVGLDGCKKSGSSWIRSPERPARTQSLYRLRYPRTRILRGRQPMGLQAVWVKSPDLHIYIYSPPPPKKLTAG
jgi:hypothetical protein